MALTDFAVKKLVAKEKSYRVSGAKGLALLVHVNGSKYWQWRISPDRMKMRQPHIVPLSRQALAILRDLYRLTGPDGYLFPHPRTNTRPMSDNAVLPRIDWPSLPGIGRHIFERANAG